MSTHRIVQDKLKPFTLSWHFVGNLLAIFTGIFFWLIQVFDSSLLIDGFNSLILISVFLFFAYSYSFLGLALICGYLAGSLQGIIISDTQMNEGVILTTSLTSLILSIFLVISRGSLRKTHLNFLIIIISIPALFTVVSFAFSDYHFIFSEFKKFLMFIVFLMVALTFNHTKIKEIINITSHTIFGTSLFAILAFKILGIEYNYGGLIYAAIPSSILLLPILYFVYQSKILLFYTLFILLILLLGFLQPSAKLLIILFCVLLLELRKVKLSRILSFAAFALVINFAALEFDTNMNHKIYSLFSSFSSIAEIISLGVATNASVFFFTSVGNIVAEFFTVLGVLIDNLFLPLGVGFVVPDLYGWLSYANDAAYNSASTPNAKYPLHLGFYYLVIWYGPLILIFKNFRKIFIFLISFSLFSLSAPSLIFLSAILTTKSTKNLSESIRTNKQFLKKSHSNI